MAKWEYKLIKINITRYIESDMKTLELEIHLNELGILGWEVINVFDLNSADGKSSFVVVSLKRELSC